jgi:response regulator RpfG family c-di-GMP phosphodiesterase
MPINQQENAGLEHILEPKTSGAQAAGQYPAQLVPKYNYAMERVLVVEDDRAVQRALKRLFEAKGYSVDIAGTGTAALEVFQNNPPSLVVLDLRLPGASGKEVCREIKTKSPSLPSSS